MMRTKEIALAWGNLQPFLSLPPVVAAVFEVVVGGDKA
jgi:hypothetical protein